MSTAPSDARQLTPVMQQYLQAKQQHPDALVFFRLGDFYEMFFDDAQLASRLLDLTLTSRGSTAAGEKIPMAGVPHHAASAYIARLLQQGQRVALCEQLDDPTKVKGIVRREVVRVITPALCLDGEGLAADRDNALVAVVADAGGFGLAAFELSTGTLRLCALPDAPMLLAELCRLAPRELLPVGPWPADLRLACEQSLGPHTVWCDGMAVASCASAAPGLALPAEAPEVAVRAAEAAWAYAQQQKALGEAGAPSVQVYDPAAHLLLNESAIRQLELVRTFDGERQGSLLALLDETSTPMGARLLRRRLLAPLTDLGAIQQRLAAVQVLVDAASLRRSLRRDLAEVGDLERLATRIAYGVAGPRDLGALRRALQRAASIARGLAELPASAGAAPLAAWQSVDRCASLADELHGKLADDLPATLQEGGVFRAGVDAVLDAFRQQVEQGQAELLALEQQERQRTGIASLKVGYTRVFGHFIEVSRARLAAVPTNYKRKQTVANGERYVTDELRDLQDRLAEAQEGALGREAELLLALRQRCLADVPAVRRLALQLADLDVHANFAELAHRDAYVCPLLDRSLAIELREARHSVVEASLPRGSFVPNDLSLDASEDASQPRLLVVTGPNMAGKSTCLRQTAIAVVLAQAGGFVPAALARIGIVDRLFTRIGASDQLARGQSTFMVEMRETAQMLAGATQRSLLILDEIGRGTSTHDGLAIAGALVEYLHDHLRCRVLFATHHHEVCALAANHPGIANVHVAAQEVGDRIIFGHRLLPGAADRSYGIAVARLAGLPPALIARAEQRLTQLQHNG